LTVVKLSAEGFRQSKRGAHTVEMATDAEKKQLLADYTAAVVEERESWRRLNDTQLTPVEQTEAYARWKAAADLVKALAARLREAAIPRPAPPPE
jgi:hypothetical protein